MRKLSPSSFTFVLILAVVSIMMIYNISSADEMLATSSVLKQTSVSDASPVMFRALDQMPIDKQVGITPMTDGQLASIEGGRRGGVNIGVNVAVIVPINIAVLSRDVIQTNTVTAIQANWFRR